ncbi:hypothetical protein [Streptomyces sp. NPDC101249]|uniref:hypothetical protein n=1 Tax=Streptomyces sp. NPDC101249 TaxID=3366140 RepID=UPI0037F2C621
MIVDGLLWAEPEPDDDEEPAPRIQSDLTTQHAPLERLDTTTTVPLTGEYL